MTSGHKLKSVERYGKRYIKEYLSYARDRRDDIKGDPLTALSFMHGKLFMRGRRDTVSVDFRDRARKVLGQYKAIQDIDLIELEQELRAEGVNNRHDRQMVAGSIRFARSELQAYGFNVYTWAVDAICTGQSAMAYAKLDCIHAVGDKLATFFLRDVAFLENAESLIGVDDYIYFQPVDTWVERVALDLDVIDEADCGRHYAIKRKIIAQCLAAQVSPLLFNAGAWMVGAHAYRLLLERL